MFFEVFRVLALLVFYDRAYQMAVLNTVAGAEEIVGVLPFVNGQNMPEVRHFPV